MKILSIDNERFYGKELRGQNLVILFKRPSNANDIICEEYMREILHILENHGDNLFASDVISRTNWDLDVRQEIGSTLYICQKDKEPITADIHCVRNGIIDELVLEGKLVAKIESRTEVSHWFRSFLFLIILLLVIGVLIWNTKRIEMNRVSTNQDAYALDIQKINELDSLLKQSISSDHSYSIFILAKESDNIARRIDSLRIVATNNIGKVKDNGDYSSVVYDDVAIRASIVKLVDDAKASEHEALERKRIRKNKESYEKDLASITDLKVLLSNKTTNQFFSSYISNAHVRSVEVTLDSLSNIADSSLKKVNNSGLYVPILINRASIEKRIETIVQVAQQNYNKAHSKIGKTPKNTTLRNENQSFNQYVTKADVDYREFYKSGDRAAALRAIGNYDRALNIKYDYNVSNRRNKLKKAIK